MDTSGPVVAYCRVSTLEAEAEGLRHRHPDSRRDALRRVPRRLCRSLLQERGAKRRSRETLRAATALEGLPERLSWNWGVAFARSPFESVRLAENLFYDLEQLGVRVLIAEMPTHDSRDRKDVMLRHIREVVAEESRKDIIERLWKGRREGVRKGSVPGVNVSYGYRQIGRHLEIHAGEAAIVRTIFGCAYENVGAIRTAHSLNTKGVVRRNRKP